MTTTPPSAKKPRRSRSSSTRRRKRKTEAASEPILPVGDEGAQGAADEPVAIPDVAVQDALVEIDTPLPVPVVDPEAGFVARMPPPEPARPFPATRHGVFFDVENTSRAEHVSRVLHILALDWVARSTELIAVGNWRVIGHETARLLAGHGAQLVHSAPSVGVRDWSDLRIAVAAGCWLAGARPGDQLQIVTDDQAFDAVGDVAASLGVRFQRLSYRALAGVMGDVRIEAPAEPRGAGRRSRRGGRGGRGRRSRYEGPIEPSRPPRTPVEDVPPAELHTAPHDEILTLVYELLKTSPGGISLDALSNALKGRGFRRPPGSPRLITRINRIKELAVLPGNMIQLADGAAGQVAALAEAAGEAEVAAEETTSDGAPSVETAAAPEGERRRRRRRGGRRRRGRGRSGGGGMGASEPGGTGDEPVDGNGNVEAAAFQTPALEIADPAPEAPEFDGDFDFDPIG